MSTTPKAAKRYRKRQNKQAAQAARQAAYQKAKRRRRGWRVGIVVTAAVALLALVLIQSVGSGKKSSSAVKLPSGCTSKKPAAVKNRPKFTAAPPLTIDPAKKYTATITTTCGTIVAQLDAAGAPNTVNNFVFLAGKHFYDGLTWHRNIADFVIQGGDPQGTGNGGPGYQFADELPKDGYQIGSLAMANSGPNTNGSQFFIVTGQQGASLPSNYSRFGKVTKGLDVAQKLTSAQFLADSGKPPKAPAYMFKVSITESGT